MKKKTIVAVCLLTVMMSLCVASCASADSVVGNWKGKAKVSLLPFSLSAKLTFSGDGTFKLSVTGLTATGQYSVSGNTISVTPKSLSGLLASQLLAPEDIGTATFSYSLAGSDLSMSGSLYGVDGSLSMSRK